MLSDDELRAVLIAEARRMAEQAGENPDSMTVDEDHLGPGNARGPRCRARCV